MMDDGKEGCLERRVSGVIVLTVLCRVWQVKLVESGGGILKLGYGTVPSRISSYDRDIPLFISCIYRQWSRH